MDAPEGFPYLKLTAITERIEYSEDDRELTYYSTEPFMIDYRQIIPICWYRYKIKNIDGTEGYCVVCEYEHAESGVEEQKMFDITHNKFTELVTKWNEYKESIKHETP